MSEPVKGTGRAQGKPAAARVRVRYSTRVRGGVISAISVLCLFSVLFVMVGAYMVSTFSTAFTNKEGDFYESISLTDEETGGTDVVDDIVIQDNAQRVADITLRGDTKNVTNILLLGVDSRSATSFSGRSDSMILLTINRQKKTIQMTSFMRDTYSAIAGRDGNKDGRDDWEKLAHAYAYGGFQMLSKTYEQNFRIKIDKHIAVNFNIFEDCVETLGGVMVDLTEAECRWMGLPNPADGPRTLDGKRTLEYARIRKLDSDYKRTGRQRIVLTAILEKLKTMNAFTVKEVVDAVAPNVNTSMTPDELTAYALSADIYQKYAITDEGYFPYPDSYQDKNLPSAGSVQVITDPAATVLELHRRLYG